MAFEIPQHLPRKALPQDVSSKILNRIDQAVVKDLDATLASSWVSELDESIAATKTRIHDRIQEELPNFHQQLEASKSVQSRAQALSHEVSRVEERILSSTGLLPTTLRTLQVHASLAQKARDATVIAESLSHLLKCKEQYTSLTALVKLGKLPEAVVASVALDATCCQSPEALDNAAVIRDLKRKLQASKSRIEEQLLNAVSTALVVNPMRLTVRSEVSLPESETILALEAILRSLSSESLQEHLSTFRKHFATNFIEAVLQQPFSVGEGMSMTEHVLNLTPASPKSESRERRLQNLAQILDFAKAHIFSKLPESQSISFPRSLVKPVTTNVMNLFLVPQLPSSFGLLTPFLSLVKEAVEFEEQYIVGVLKGDPRDRPVKDWSDSLANHYERQRRNILLENCRSLMKEPLDLTSTFLVQAESTEPHVVTAVNGDGPEAAGDDAWGLGDDVPTTATNVEESWGFGEEEETSVDDMAEGDSWGLDDDKAGEITSPTAESWGFDDDVGGEEPAADQTHSPSSDDTEEPMTEEEEDDPWGWNDDKVSKVEDQPAEDNAWDDPWGDPDPEPEVIVAVKPAKSATKLEKMASKGKKLANGNGNPTTHHSPPQPPKLTLQPSSTQQTITQSSANLSSRSAPAVKPIAIVTQAPPPVEHYRVTERTKRIVRMAEDAIAEGKQFAASNLFAKLAGGSIPGSTLLQTATSVLDLFQALHPVRYDVALQSVEGALQYSNDCIYLSDSIEKLEQEASGQLSLKERLADSKHHLRVLGDSWFQDAVERECRKHDKLLSEGTQGFTYTMDQDRYDECESAIMEVMRSIKDLARRIKPILPKNKYYQAVGRFVDAALNRVTRNIVALPDITEVESHRLSELCRMFDSLQGMFSENSESSFVVAYVPSWLKFNYLSELLEASLADITYLFEEGALVDFETDELVNLVRALFADTPLRTNTINKLLTGQHHSS